MAVINVVIVFIYLWILQVKGFNLPNALKIRHFRNKCSNSNDNYNNRIRLSSSSLNTQLLSGCRRDPSESLLNNMESSYQSSSAKNYYVNLYDLTSELVDYDQALRWQESLVKYHQSLQDSNTNRSNTERTLVGSLIALQHKHVYTLGSGTTSESGPFSEFDSQGQKLNFDTYKVNRAGQATYHGPGQLVLYPILDLVSSCNLLHFHHLPSSLYCNSIILIKTSTNF
jgi:hypothetical protein